MSSRSSHLLIDKQHRSLLCPCSGLIESLISQQGKCLFTDWMKTNTFCVSCPHGRPEHIIFNSVNSFMPAMAGYHCYGYYHQSKNDDEGDYAKMSKLWQVCSCLYSGYDHVYKCHRRSCQNCWMTGWVGKIINLDTQHWFPLYNRFQLNIFGNWWVECHN